MSPSVISSQLAMSTTRTTRINKVLLTIALCTTGAWCANDDTLTRNARTIGSSSSFFAWPRVFRDLWANGTKLWEWSKSGAMSLARFTSTSKTPMRIAFRPEDGKRAAVTYQRQYGYRGEWLVEQLGNGLGPGLALLHSQPVPNTFLTPPLPSFHSQ